MGPKGLEANKTYGLGVTQSGKHFIVEGRMDFEQRVTGFSPDQIDIEVRPVFFIQRNVY